jgi:predicted nucleic acid-binding Zn ribbon protein
LRLGEVLGKVLADCGLSGRIAEREVLDNWADIVGEKIARHVRPVDIEDGVLLLDADHGAWRQEVSLLAPEIVRRFNTFLGDSKVREIGWRFSKTSRRNTDKRR